MKSLKFHQCPNYFVSLIGIKKMHISSSKNTASTYKKTGPLLQLCIRVLSISPP
jgi:hypothetical protein